MTKYKIGFIDEQEGQIDDFLTYFDEYKDEIEVIIIDPNEKDIETLVDEVFDKKCQIVVIDYYLKFSSEVAFNGDELLLRIKERRLNLPLMILTSDVEKAKTEGELLSPDVRVIDKELINGDDPGFKDELVHHISYYERLRIRYNEEFAELRLKQEKGQKLDGKQKRRVIELNHILEEMGDRQLYIVPIVNQREQLSEINHLISETRKIIKKLSDKDE